MIIFTMMDSQNPSPLLRVGTRLSAGVDIPANESRTIPPGGTVGVPSGWRVDMHAGYWLAFVSRSGLALKSNIHVLNAPGVVDPDYEGELVTILHNAGKKEFKVERGDYIAQAIVMRNYMAAAPIGVTKDIPVWRTFDGDKLQNIQFVKDYRGVGGYGSTDSKE